MDAKVCALTGFKDCWGKDKIGKYSGSMVNGEVGFYCEKPKVALYSW